VAKGLGRGRRSRASHPPEDRIHPGDQFARAERLCHVVVAADLEAEDAIDFLVARRQKQDRRIGIFPDLAADFQSIHLRHADVEHHELVDVAVEPGQRLLAVLRDRNHHSALLERKAHDVTDMRVIVDDENGMSHVCASLCRFCQGSRDSAVCQDC
jgi:hypothetical protein